MAIKKVELNYPYNVKVVGKTVIDVVGNGITTSLKTDKELKDLTEDAFYKWLKDNNSIYEQFAYCASVLHRGQGYYQRAQEELGWILFYDQAWKILELFENQTIEFVVDM